MNPETHLLASWVIGAKGTDNARDCRLVTLAGILPDADGLGLIVDCLTRALGWKKTFLYEHYHHFLFHGIFGAILITLLLTCVAHRKWRAALLALLVFHLHHVDPTPLTCGHYSILGLSSRTRCGFGRDNGRWTPGQTGY